MIGAANRSRLLQLRQEQQAARIGRDLLDNKREAILRELLQRVRLRDSRRDRLRRAGQEASAALDTALVEIGPRAADTAALAQPSTAAVELRPASLVGVPVPRLHAKVPPYRPHYGIAGTSASLDSAGERFTALLVALVALAEDEEAVRHLQEGLRKTVRRLQALEKVVIPRLEREAREVAAALEEEERDESFRRKRWLSARGGSGQVQ
jgi:V/A-type H+-transporting ATPase subunit D